MRPLPTRLGLESCANLLEVRHIAALQNEANIGVGDEIAVARYRVGVTSGSDF